MEVQFNVEKEGRKALVKAVSEITGQEPEYLGAPSFAFAVGGCTIGRHGMLTFDERTGEEEIRSLLSGLSERGFAFEGGTGVCDAGGGDEADQSGAAEPCGIQIAEADNGTGGDRLAINMPLSGFTASSLGNLEKLVAAKAWIIRKMAGADGLPIERDGEYLRFPWFKAEASAARTNASIVTSL